MHSGIWFSHQRNEILSFMTTCMKLEGFMWREISQTQKDKYCMLSYVESRMVGPYRLGRVVGMGAGTKIKLTRNISKYRLWIITNVIKKGKKGVQFPNPKKWWVFVERNAADPSWVFTNYIHVWIITLHSINRYSYVSIENKTKLMGSKIIQKVE